MQDKLADPVFIFSILLLLLTVRSFITNNRDRWVHTGLFVVFILISTPLPANLLVSMVEDNTSHISSCINDSHFNNVVVLGGGIQGDPDDPEAIDRLKIDTYSRTIVAFNLYKLRNDLNIVVSGGWGASVREADLMSQLLVKLGIPQSNITAERNSKTTYQNALYVKRILDRNNTSKIILITSALHMPRAERVFDKFGFDVCKFMTDSIYIDVKPQDAFIPQISSLTKTSAVLHEIAGFLYYYVTNRI